MLKHQHQPVAVGWQSHVTYSHSIHPLVLSTSHPRVRSNDYNHLQDAVCPKARHSLLLVLFFAFEASPLLNILYAPALCLRYHVRSETEISIISEKLSLPPLHETITAPFAWLTCASIRQRWELSHTCASLKSRSTVKQRRAFVWNYNTAFSDYF